VACNRKLPKLKRMQKLSAIIALSLTVIAILWSGTVCLFSQEPEKEQITNQDSEVISTPDINDLTIKVVYDNNPYNQELGTAWGFSALITGTDKTILFDTGGDGSLLLNNMKKLAIEPNNIDVVVLSHIHGDHTGGLSSFLEKNSSVSIYLPESFPTKFKENIQKYGAQIVEVKQTLKICENIYSTGQLGRLIKEHSLIIRTKAGLIVITGCAHPGIVEILTTTKDFMKGDILLVMGGFHLESASKHKIEKIISALKQMNVKYVGPCHCSGHKARTLFKKHFGTRYIEVGVGKVIKTAHLQ
jgi:7,8-dihydropterin-6-yl-methyl-4-(beta-D-ribofuranosyl)aminobenzene 5'-phosphate synthase